MAEDENMNIRMNREGVDQVMQMIRWVKLNKKMTNIIDQENIDLIDETQDENDSEEFSYDEEPGIAFKCEQNIAFSDNEVLKVES